MAEKDTPYLPPDPTPLYILIVLLGCICCYSFFLGTVVVRLWFYKGELGPAPEKFIVIRDRILASDKYEPSSTASHLRPGIPQSDDTAVSAGLDPRTFSTATTINMQDMGDPTEIQDLKLRAIIKEEQDISRMQAFDADDGGDGWFPGIPVAYKPVEEIIHPTKKDGSQRLGLKASERRNWLAVNKNWIQYLKYHEARSSLLAANKDECIYTHQHPHTEESCEELLQAIAAFLVETYPDKFTYQSRHFGKKHIRNELTHEEYSLARPFDHPPIEVCARLATEDFQVFMRDDFSREWYL
jgi:hypothetical protein